MLSISREAKVKVARHAWNVYPLEAFGFLLGRESEGTVYAALPCSKTQRWHEFDDRWAGIEENIEKAHTVARLFDMEVAGFYASMDGFYSDSPDRYPVPSFIAGASMGLLMVYRTICCPAHSWASFKRGNHWLKQDDDYVVPRGKRITNSISQKKMLKAWCSVFGPIDYSNRQERDRDGNNAFIAGDRVLHPKFGKGTVMGRAINPEDGKIDRVQVRFDSGCGKWLALEYARLLLLDSDNDKLAL